MFILYKVLIIFYNFSFNNKLLNLINQVKIRPFINVTFHKQNDIEV
jgi:hypothetical protein